MHHRVFSPLALVATLAVAITASCNGYQPTGTGGSGIMVTDRGRSVFPTGFTPNQTRPDWMKPPPTDGATAARIAVAQFGSSSVLWYPLNDKKNAPPTVCEPATSTNGIAIDRYGNLWVPNGIANTTTEYAPNCGSAKQTIPDKTGEPADVTFNGTNHVYILNLNNKSGPPTVEYYNATTGAQLGTLSNSSFYNLEGIGTDRLGNVFISNLTKNNVGIVLEFPKGKMPGTQLSGVSLGLPGAPAFDRSNNLIIADWLRNTIDVFAPPYNGSPSTAPLEGTSIWCKLNYGQSHLYCGDAANGSIDVYSYPGNAYQYSYTSGLSPSALVTGVAPYPAAPYK